MKAQVIHDLSERAVRAPCGAVIGFRKKMSRFTYREAVGTKNPDEVTCKRCLKIRELRRLKKATSE